MNTTTFTIYTLINPTNNDTVDTPLNRLTAQFYQSPISGTIYSRNAVKETIVSADTNVNTTNTVQPFTFNVLEDTDISTGSLRLTQQHEVTFTEGDKYRAYSIKTNRWDLFTFEKTPKDIAMVVSGFAVKCNSTKAHKIEVLKALNVFYNLGLSEETINESVNN